MDKFINKVIQGDCLEVMKHIPDKSIDLILTDPPYGIKADKGIGGFGTSKTDKHYKGGWDNNRPSKEYFDEIIRISKQAIIFGGNFFADLLPQGNHWIFWDKKGDIKFQNPYSDFLCQNNKTKKNVFPLIYVIPQFLLKLSVKIAEDSGFHQKKKLQYVVLKPPHSLWGTGKRNCEKYGKNTLFLREINCRHLMK